MTSSREEQTVDFNKMFDQECEENYWDIVNFVSSYLMRTNKEYKDSACKCSDIIDEYPNLQKVLEDNIPVALTKEEVSGLIEYISNALERNTLEKKQLVCAGCRSTYFLLKKIGLLKENNASD